MWTGELVRAVRLTEMIWWKYVCSVVCVVICLFLTSGRCLLCNGCVGCCHFCLIGDACSWRCSFMGRVCFSSCRCCVCVCCTPTSLTNKSPFLKSYLHKVDAKLHLSPLCPLCNTHTHDTHHILNFTHIRTTLSPLDLWLVDQKWDDRTPPTNKGQGSG